jgi:N-formylglutamate deformylase
VHAPHTSRHIPQDVRHELLVDDEELRTELDRMTDLGVANVLDGLSTGVDGTESAVVTAMFSRLVFDPERFPDGDEMEAVGMGVVYTQCADGAPLRDALPAERLSWYRAQHHAYTNSFEQVATLAVERFGSVVIVDLHSYPQDALGYEDATRRRPQVCVGTDPEHTPEWLRTLAEDVLGDRFDTGLNTPFSGAYVPGELYGTDRRVFSVMLEFRRDVLADPRGLEQAIEAVREIVRRAGEIVRTRAEATRG